MHFLITNSPKLPLVTYRLFAGTDRTLCSRHSKTTTPYNLKKKTSCAKCHMSYYHSTYALYFLCCINLHLVIKDTKIRNYYRLYPQSLISKETSSWHLQIKKDWWLEAYKSPNLQFPIYKHNLCSLNTCQGFIMLYAKESDTVFYCSNGWLCKNVKRNKLGF